MQQELERYKLEKQMEHERQQVRLPCTTSKRCLHRTLMGTHVLWGVTGCTGPAGA